MVVVVIGLTWGFPLIHPHRSGGEAFFRRFVEFRFPAFPIQMRCDFQLAGKLMHLICGSTWSWSGSRRRSKKKEEILCRSIYAFVLQCMWHFCSLSSLEMYRYDRIMLQRERFNDSSSHKNWEEKNKSLTRIKRSSTPQCAVESAPHYTNSYTEFTWGVEGDQEVYSYIVYKKKVFLSRKVVP